MTEDEFKAALRAVIDRAKMNQLTASVILQELADEQRDEFDERETASRTL